MSQRLSPEDPREIAKWAGRYARSRTIPFLVQWIFIVTLAVVLGLLSQGAVNAYRARQTTLQWCFTAAIAVTTLTVLWFSVAKWGRVQIWRISQWVYGKEGYVSFEGRTAPSSPARMHWVPIIALLFGVYHLIGAVLVGLHVLPMKYLQPYSAPCMVLFLAIMIIRQRLGFWAWLWPILYGIHALFLIAGVPIRFAGSWGGFFDILLPVFGYGFLSMIVGHMYSRYAFRKLRQLARAGLVDSQTAGEDSGE